MKSFARIIKEITIKLGTDYKSFVVNLYDQALPSCTFMEFCYDLVYSNDDETMDNTADVMISLWWWCKENEVEFDDSYYMPGATCSVYEEDEIIVNIFNSFREVFEDLV